MPGRCPWPPSSHERGIEMTAKDERTELELLQSIDKRLNSIANWVSFMGVILLITVVVSSCSAIL